MTLAEAIKSNRPFKRPYWDECSCYYLAETGPHINLVSCSYFTHGGIFSTSIDLYAEDVLADDYYLSDSIQKLSK